VEEKQIQIIIDDEIVDSISDIPAWTRNDFLEKYFQVNSSAKLIEYLEFEAFVAVFAEWR
jgi:hypothetical protein